MTAKVPNAALAQILEDAFVTGHDIRVILVMTATSVDTEIDTVEFVGDYTTLDEMDGANYSRPALTGEVATADDVNDRGELDATDLTYTSLGAGSRNIQGLLLYEHVTNDADSPTKMYIPFASSVAADGNNFLIQWSDEGIAWCRQGS